MEEFNPKIHERNDRNLKKTGSFDFSKIKDPISLEVKDPKEILDLYKRWPLIPFAGIGRECRDGLLHFFNKSRFISPTLGACHESIKTYTIGSKLKIEYLTDPDFDIDTNARDITLEQQVSFRDFVRSCGDIKKLSEDLYSSLKDNGNYFLEIVHTTVLGEPSTKFIYHPTTNCRYRATTQKQDKIVVISNYWSHDYLMKNPPLQIPLYPNYIELKDTFRTIIHVKNGNFIWYGRPDWVGAWRSVFREFQDLDYLTKMSANFFTGQVFIEIEEDNVQLNDPLGNEPSIEDGEETVMEKFERNFTLKSNDPQTVMLTTRPFGARPAHVYQFSPNMNENYFDITAKLARRQIIENNQWSERLLGNAIASGFSKDVHIDELSIKESSVLKYIRNKLSKGLNIGIQEAIKFQNRLDLEGIGISYQSSFEKTSSKNYKEQIDAFGVGVRAGTITPTQKDEEFFRNLLEVSPTNDSTDESWKEDGGYRRPITLKASEDSESEKSRLDD